ncbi:MAG: hypothetical protein FJ309_06010 [Planctomycetes bacterium]|nr:hypothetical protein [Planctomycetota bacterium]
MSRPGQRDGHPGLRGWQSRTRAAGTIAAWPPLRTARRGSRPLPSTGARRPWSGSAAPRAGRASARRPAAGVRRRFDRALPAAAPPRPGVGGRRPPEYGAAFPRARGSGRRRPTDRHG